MRFFGQWLTCRLETGKLTKNRWHRGFGGVLNLEVPMCLFGSTFACTRSVESPPHGAAKWHKPFRHARFNGEAMTAGHCAHHTCFTQTHTMWKISISSYPDQKKRGGDLIFNQVPPWSIPFRLPVTELPRWDSRMWPPRPLWCRRFGRPTSTWNDGGCSKKDTCMA